MKARLPQGMGGGPQNLNAMMRQAQKMQADMESKQQELQAKEYDISAGGGAVQIKINGKKELLSLQISEAIVDPEDIETLQDILIAAFNEAIKTVEAESADEMGRIAGSLNIPGLF
ncbi:MAG: YbaB/EbfC family nucleoid-associated protein [Eubacteriales bacterium]|nr:YbaB/EbfC family nucleoid-associated protein [Eubacteriales bacterium]